MTMRRLAKRVGIVRMWTRHADRRVRGDVFYNADMQTPAQVW